MAVELKVRFDNSALDAVLEQIKANPFAHRKVCEMLNSGKRRQLFRFRTEQTGNDLLMIIEPTPALLAIAASVMN